MNTLSEGRHAGEFLVSEAPGSLSREVVTLAAGAGKLEAGTVLARLSATGEYVAYDNAGSDGSEIAAAILFDSADATSAAVKAVAIARLAEINGADLVWAVGVDAAGKVAGEADLSAKFIAIR